MTVFAFCVSPPLANTSFAPTAVGGKIRPNRPQYIFIMIINKDHVLCFNHQIDQIKITLLNYSSLSVVERSTALSAIGLKREFTGAIDKFFDLFDQSE